ncbi:MAG: YraN family protein [Kaiparowitsia implicata GSE-PSE-MK54-09C]|jgi:putative endonuclease|nr:YraN family protein [Kaiparowitsia implicata GSE-PSE-MK54-09C]
MPPSPSVPPDRSQSRAAASSRKQAALLGQLAEQVVAQWLTQQGMTILAQRWHCRWGELDVVALHPPTLANASSSLVFVEVKARSDRSWDQSGLLAVTPQKQIKLWRAASMFLAEHPDYADLPCRFDVALVQGQRLPQTQQADAAKGVDLIRLNQPVAIAPYRLILQHYLVAAFEPA